MSERIRRWCTIHHFFHRDCADCLGKDYADLERQLAEAQGKLAAVQKELHTVTHLDKKACGHAVCGLARRVARILKEEK